MQDLALWNINCASRYIRLRLQMIRLWLLATAFSTEKMEIRSASKAMSAVFAATLQCGTKAIFWHYTHANSDSLAPESSIPGEMCWLKSASLNLHAHLQTHTDKHSSFCSYKSADAQTYTLQMHTHTHTGTNVHTDRQDPCRLQWACWQTSFT